MVDLDPEVVKLGASLTELAARNGAALVADRVRAARSRSSREETIAALEELVNELIDDKAQMQLVAQAYRDELTAQQLTPGDVKYITDTVLPTLLKVVHATGGAQAAQFQSIASALEPLLSVETVNVLQLLGFNFRRAIGEPLTALVEKQILSRAKASEALELARVERENLYARIALDPDAHARLNNIYGR